MFVDVDTRTKKKKGCVTSLLKGDHGSLQVPSPRLYRIPLQALGMIEHP